jgi:hypothetical protein
MNLLRHFRRFRLPVSARGARRRTSSRNWSAPLRLEALEDRWLPSAVTWVNASGGDWDTPGNWSTGALPTPADDVLISLPGITVTHNQSNADSINSLACSDILSVAAGSLRIAAASSITNALNLSGGTLTGPGGLIVFGLLTWTGGTMSGSGTTLASGGLSLSGTTGSEFLDGRTLVNSGAATWSGANDWQLNDGATFKNLGTGTFTAANDQTLFNFGATSTFQNAGTFTKSGGTNTTAIAGLFKNSGTVTISTGTLKLNGGGAASGLFSVASGATLDFNTVTYGLGAASTISGAGTVVFDAGTTNVAGTYDITGATTVNGGTVSLTGTLTSAGSTVTVAGGTAHFHQGFTADILNISGGTLTGAGNFFVNSALNWTGGTMAGSGETAVAGAGVLSISGSVTETLDARELLNEGTGTWSGTGNLSFVNGAMFENGGSFTITNDQSIALSGFGIIVNVGTFTKSPNTNTTTITPVFYNNGTLNVDSGTLSLQGGGSSIGTVTVAAGAGLDFGGGVFKLRPGSTLSGTGAVTFSAGTVDVAGTYNISGGGSTTIQGAIANFVGVLTSAGPVVTVSAGTANFARNFTTTTLALSGGTLTGASAITVNGSLAWTGGTMAGTGSTTLAHGGSLTISGPASIGVTLDTRTLVNQGTGNLLGTGPLAMGNGALLSNMGGASFTILNDQPISSFGTSPTISNAGTFQKTPGTNTTTVSPIFQNTGTFKVSSGTVVLQGGGANSHVFTVGAGTGLVFGGGSFRFSPTSILSGAGSVSFSAGVAVVAGGYGISGAASSTTVNGGTVSFTGTISAVLASLTVSSGVASFHAPYTVGTLALGGGTLTGAGDTTVTHQMTWSGGTLAGSGTTTIGASAVLHISPVSPTNVTLDARTLDLEGTGTWSGTGNIVFTDAAQLFNAGLFTVTNDQDLSFSGFGKILNLGTFQKSPNTNTTVIGTLFYNAGTVQAVSGTLSLQGGGACLSGSMTVSSGAGLDFGGGVFHFDAGTSLSGSGAVTFSAGTVILNGVYDVSGAGSSTTIQGATVRFVGTLTSAGPTVVVSSGTADFHRAVSIGTLNVSGGTVSGSADLAVTNSFSWTGGSLAGTGSVSVGSGASLAIGGSSGKTLDGWTLNNAGTGTFSGTGSLSLDNGAVFNNQSTGTFTLMNDQGFLAFGLTSTVNNAGTFTKSPSTNTTEIDAVFNNTGAVNVSSGTLYLAGGGLSSGTFAVASGATLKFGGFFTLLASGSSVSGAGAVVFANGTADVEGSYSTTGATSVTGGTVNFLTSVHTNTFTTAGTVSIAAGTTFTVTSGDYTQTAGTSLLNGGTITLAAGHGVKVQGGTFAGLGTINGNLFNAGTLQVGGIGSTGVLTVNGTFTQTSTGNAVFELEGISAGTQYDQLVVTGSATLAGTLTVQAIDGFVPPVSSTFTILTYASHTGDFASFSPSGNGRTLTRAAGGTSYTITAS